jgi:predicted RNA methylase
MPVKITFFQRLLSYILPVTILKTKSEFNAMLEVAVENGKLVLNSANANYSYGSLFKVFKKSFEVFTVDLKKCNSVLMLGMGAGSVVKYIAEKNPKAKIDAVEIDESVIAIAEQVFEINKLSSVSIIHSDASEYLQTGLKLFDLILIDLFVDKEVPSFCMDEDFVKQLTSLCTASTKIIFNISMGIKSNERDITFYFQKYFQKVIQKKINGNSFLYAENKT